MSHSKAHKQRRLFFGPLVIYTDRHLLAKQVYDTVARDGQLHEESGKVGMKFHDEIYWENQLVKRAARH